MSQCRKHRDKYCQNMVFHVLYASKRLACYCGKMYSRHLFFLQRTEFHFPLLRNKNKEKSIRIKQNSHQSNIYINGTKLTTHPIPVQRSFNTSASLIETLRSSSEFVAISTIQKELPTHWQQECHQTKGLLGNAMALHGRGRYEPLYIAELSSAQQHEITIICVCVE